VYGPPATMFIPSKVEGLKDYRYSVVVENTCQDWYFTEKIIDPLSQGCVPIYWGCDVSQFFDMGGIITFESVDELKKILDNLSIQDYMSRMKAIRHNFTEAEKYRCAEDWIIRRYPDIFKERGK
jgi:hypothetical protein